MSDLDKIFNETIQVSRLGNANSPKPSDKVWFTTQMQDLFVLELDHTKQAIKTLMLKLIDEASINPEFPEVNTYDENGTPIIYTDKLRQKVESL